MGELGGSANVVWIALAFVLGLMARLIGLPPLVGYLAAGFLLNAHGVTGNELIQTLADLGITLLLFTVGLKLNLRTLARPQVWAVTAIHMAVVTGIMAASIFVLSLAGEGMLADLNVRNGALIAFALSFSSTVFVVKVLEERGEVTSLHGRIAIGILLMQDVAAVVFLAVSSGKVPSVWALSLLLLIPARPLMNLILARLGHGELLVLCGFLLALGGAAIFEQFGLKGDLGALVMGVLIASHAKADEMGKAMLNFKDLFLLGFFLSIGLSGQPSMETFLIAAAITPFIFLKSTLFFALLTRFRLRARTSLLASLNLTNYSEFGLVVVAIGVANGWIVNEWLIVLAIALSLSFVIAAGLNSASAYLSSHHREFWLGFQRAELIDDDQLLDLRGASVAVIGMGGVGTGAYDEIQQHYEETLIGIDIDPVTARNQQEAGRNVLRGDPSDADFWDRVEAAHTLKTVMLALPQFSVTLAVLEQLSASTFSGHVAAIARFPEEVERLQEAGATTVFNMYAEAGAGFVAHVAHEVPVFAANNG